MAVIDFETTGSDPLQGARATEIGIVLIEGGQIIDRFSSLMKTGAWISPFIEALTGISEDMLENAPAAEDVMQEAADFVGDLPMVAHNAGFDRRIWDAELARIGRERHQAFACSLMLARRVFPEAPRHGLGELVKFLGLPDTGVHHRALADAEMAAHLLIRIAARLNEQHGLRDTPHALLCQIQQMPKQKLAVGLRELALAVEASD